MNENNDSRLVIPSSNNIDYVKDGKIYKNIYKNESSQSILISSEEDLNLLTSYSPGTIAFTAGFSSMWQKNVDGNWEIIL